MLPLQGKLKMTKPTVGRIVHYYPKGVSEVDKRPLAAMIVCVWSDTCVNLAIFDRNGEPLQKPPTSILLIQEGNPVPTGGGYCEWPPRG